MHPAASYADKQSSQRAPRESSPSERNGKPQSWSMAIIDPACIASVSTHPSSHESTDKAVYRNNETARLEISGIGQNNCRKNSFFYVPFDKNVGIVGYQYDDLIGVEGILQVPVTRYPLDPYRLEGIRGMPLHVHCWSFIK